MLMCVLNINLLRFFALQRLRLRRLVIGLEQRDFHSTPSYMKVTHTHTHAHTQTDTQTHRHAKVQDLPSCLVSHKDFPPSNLSFCSFLLLVFSLSLSLSLPLCVLFFPSSLFLSLFLPSLHLRIPVFWATAFYFQASVPVQREGSWERPCYHCWDSQSFSVPLSLSSFFHLSPSTHHSSSSHPAVKACIFLLSLSFLLFIQSSFLLPPFWKTHRRSFMWWSSGLIQLRHKQEMAPVI